MFPVFGALVCSDGVCFRVHAPRASALRVVLEGAVRGEHPMSRDADGIWTVVVTGLAAGQLYRLRLDDGPLLPDPASRFQPHGVHGPSAIIDPGAFAWSDAGWRGCRADELIVYELHVGAFSDEGTFGGAAARLAELRDLGVTAVELMPIADFAGDRNWGYDGVAPFAPSRAYGRPDDLRAFVDQAHALGLAVILDVVYNHLGPEGAYLPQFNPEFLLDRHTTPWGAAVNLDGPGSALVRRFITDNAVHWVREYHLDGLRLDATHALIDQHRPHFMRELATAVRAAAARPIVLHAEDHRNLRDIVEQDEAWGWGLDGVWADDFHHIVRRMVAGDAHAYYADFEGTTTELARTIRQGWLFTGEHSKHLQRERGTDPSAVPMHRFVVSVQNHDQIGNRAFGERLHHEVDEATWRAVSLLLLTSPMTPLLFMGQEWAASTPFLFFTDLEPGLGRLVTEGRRREFSGFPQFSDPRTRERIPDPQARSTFEASRLRHEERARAPHGHVHALYRALLRLRRDEPAFGASTDVAGDAQEAGADAIVVRREHHGTAFLIAVQLRGAGCVGLPGTNAGVPAPAPVLTTEEPAFAAEPRPVRVTMHAAGAAAHFSRPGGAIFRLPAGNR